MNEDQFNLKKTNLITLLIIITTLFLFLQTNLSFVLNMSMQGVLFYDSLQFNTYSLIEGLNLSGDKLEMFQSNAQVMKNKSTILTENGVRTKKIIETFNFFILMTILIIILISFFFRYRQNPNKKMRLIYLIKILIIYNLIFCFIIWLIKDLILTNDCLTEIVYYSSNSIETLFIILILLLFIKTNNINKKKLGGIKNEMS